MIRSFLLVAASSIAVATTAVANAGAQALEGEPFVSVAGSVGMVVVRTVQDGRSLSGWDFSTARQYRATIDKSTSDNTHMGLTVGYASLPLKYARIGVPNHASSCPSICEADADLWSVALSLRVVSGTTGVHQILESNLGMSIFSDFRSRATDEKLGPLSGDKDVTFTVGYGVGWAASRRIQFSVIGDLGFTVHTQSGRDADVNAVNSILGTRFVVRTGLGR